MKSMNIKPFPWPLSNVQDPIYPQSSPPTSIFLFIFQLPAQFQQEWLNFTYPIVSQSWPLDTPLQSESVQLSCSPQKQLISHFSIHHLRTSLTFNNYMHRLTLNKSKSKLENILALPLTKPIRTTLKESTTIRSLFRSLSQSRTLLPVSASASTPRLKQPMSFYNDRSQIYLRKSNLLSEQNQSFQNKTLSFSQRKRYQSTRTQQIVKQRENINKSISRENIQKQRRSSVLDKFHQIASNKYKKLLYGQQMVKVNRGLLQQGIKRSMSEQHKNRWKSPFKVQSKTQRLRGRPLVSKQQEPILPPGNPTQLKVLNLDRLFRKRDGKLTNVVPLPVAKLSEVSSREYLIKAVKHQDKIHEAIQEYNRLLKLSQLEKTKPKLGIQGTKFTKTPTIEQLMGLKMGPSKNPRAQDDPLLEKQIFTSHCQHFQGCVKQDIHLRRRIVAGLTRQETSGYITLSSFALFWQLFISRTAKIEEKTEFLVYFFLPVGQERVQLSVIRLILEVMCQDLPPIEKLNLKTDILTGKQKSRIFLQALTRVLFGQISIPEGRGISRGHLNEILASNPDACDLLIRLLQTDE